MAKREATKTKSSAPRAARVAAEAGMVVSEPSHEQIARRAFELYLSRGNADGDAVSDWLRAERELRAARA